jgi:radical SAM protein with 4Fe4S-binding SPASM domain
VQDENVHDGTNHRVLSIELQDDGKLVNGSPVREIPFSSLQARLQSEGRRIPLDGTIETTFRCNLNCVHCYVNEPANSCNPRSRELSTARLTSLIDEVAEAGCLSLLLTGGECLLRRDFPEVYLHALKKGLLVTVFTNGTLLSERVADLLAEYKPEHLEISLYGATRDTYERITRTSGSFDRCMAGIRRAAARGLSLRLKTMAMVLNRHEVAAMRDFAYGLGAEFLFDVQLNPRVDSRANRHGDWQLTAEEVIALDSQDPRLIQELRSLCDRHVRSDAIAGADRLYSCGAGQTSFAVSPYGGLSLCLLSRKVSFDLRNDTFARGWSEFLPQLRSHRWQSQSPCRTCGLISLCGSCPAAAELEHGDPETPIARFCEIAHQRAFVVLGKIAGHRRDATCCHEDHDRPYTGAFRVGNRDPSS